MAAAMLPWTLVTAQTWDWIHPGTGGNIMGVDTDPSIDGRIYASVDVTGSYRSNDNGNNWTYISEGTQHALAFEIEVDPNNSNVLYQGNIYGLDKSTNGGNSWTAMNLPVEGPADVGDSIAEVLVKPNNSNHVLAAPGWKMKDSQKSSNLDVNQALSGKRTLYYTNNGGGNWTRETYDSTNGYRQIYNMVFQSPNQQGTVFIGAHSGVYKRTLNASGQGQYVRLPEPPNTITGRDKSTRRGGCRGVATSPDGQWLYALWTVNYVDVNDNLEADETHVFGYKTSQGNNGSWIKLGFGGNSGPDGKDTEWGYIQCDETTYYNQYNNPQHKLLIGQAIEGPTDRVGLWEATVQLNNNSTNINSTSWEIVGGNGSQGFTYDGGWTNVKWGSHTFTYVPASWSNNYIFALGANNLFRGNRNASGWPTNNAWTQVYAKSVGSVGNVASYEENGMIATVNWDMGIYNDYAIQNMADEGISESYDGGDSWSHSINVAGTPQNPNRSNSVEIVQQGSNDPLVISHFARGYGTIPNNGGLYAKKLTNYTNNGDQWKLIAGRAFQDHTTGSANGGGSNGLPSVVYEDIAAAPLDPRIVFIGTDNKGIYRTQNIYNLYNTGGSELPKHHTSQ